MSLAEQRMQLITLLTSEANTSSDSGGRYSRVAELHDELAMVEAALDGVPLEQLGMLLSREEVSWGVGPTERNTGVSATLHMSSGLRIVAVRIKAAKQKIAKAFLLGDLPYGKLTGSKR
ncbi:hypothetical protein HDF16_005212 [Granulicella aggregans]|uniref:Uncharacterized protein n=1 Tax=Granulicella aggregans TaxID=474949 RepID=A0A7W7ZJS9_9BACT|nr:hypothetical protein [Granulicella aggregans]